MKNRKRKSKGQNDKNRSRDSTQNDEESKRKFLVVVSGVNHSYYCLLPEYTAPRHVRRPQNTMSDHTNSGRSFLRTDFANQDQGERSPCLRWE